MPIQIDFKKHKTHHTAQVPAPSFTLQGWKSDADGQDDQDDDDIISYLNSVGFDFDLGISFLL